MSERPVDRPEGTQRFTGTCTLVAFRASASHAAQIIDLANTSDQVLWSSDTSEAVVVAFRLASTAVQFAVSIVGTKRLAASCGIVTAEAVDEIETLTPLASDVLKSADPGQIIICLGTQNLARVRLSGDYIFHDAGNIQVDSGRVQIRTFAVDHEDLPKLARRVNRDSASAAGFLGRYRELSDIAKLIEVYRVITVLGPCGVGKSTLLKRLQQEMETSFSDGISWVELSDVRSESILTATICRALEVTKDADETYGHALVAHLAGKSAMLILDGCERMAPHLSPIIEYLVTNCPDLQIVCGSQRPIHCADEYCYAIRGLENAPEGLDWNLALECDAVTLFAERARRADPSFRPEKQSIYWITQVCNRLAGIPFAIELAASKCQSLTPRQIHDRLDDRLHLLADKRRSRAERHCSLEAAINYSLSLLTPQAQTLLRRLSIFSGAFNLETAHQVAFGDEIDVTDFEAIFDELIDCQILIPSQIEGDEKYFYLTETWRIYGKQSLANTAEGTNLRDRRLQWVEEFAAGVSANDLLPESGDRARISAFYEDVRDAANMLVEAGDSERAANLATKCMFLWYEHRYASDGVALFKAILRTPKARQLPEFTRYLNILSVLCLSTSDPDSARMYAIESYSRAKRAGDRLLMARTANTMGMIASSRGWTSKARRSFSRALHHMDGDNDQDAIFTVLVNYLSTGKGLMDDNDLRAFQRAEEMAKTKSVAATADLYNVRANRLLDAGQPKEALLWAMNSVRLTFHMDLSLSLARQVRTLAECHAALGNAKECCIWNQFALRCMGGDVDTLNRWRTCLTDTVSEYRKTLGDDVVQRWIIESSQMTDQEFEKILFTD